MNENDRQDKSNNERSCATCGVRHCHNQDSAFPPFCPTTALTEKEIGETLDIYRGDDLDARLARTAAEVEGQFYGRLTRVEEIMEFAARMNFKRIGIATCVGLMDESRIFAKILSNRGFTVKAVCCKLGATDKTEVGLPDDLKVKPGCPENLCNPILQANSLNQWPSDFNVMVGLCVGHDSLFMRHAKAPTTVLAAKDRVLAHNPLGAIYTSKFYYKRLLQDK